MGGMADALLKAGLVDKDKAAEIDRERRKQDRQQADASLQKLLAPKVRDAPEKG